MDCYAWKIPEGCYATALASAELACPSVGWWWIAAAVAAGLALFGKKKAAASRPVRARRR